MDTVWLLGSSSQLDTLQISVVHYWSMDTVWLLGSSSQLDTLQISVVHYWSVDTIWLLPFQLDTLHCRSLLVCGHRMTTALSAGHSSDQSRSLLVCGHRMTTALLAGHSSDQSRSLLVCGHRMTTALLAGHSSLPFTTGLWTPYDYCPFSWTLFRSELFTTGLWTLYDYWAVVLSWTLFRSVSFTTGLWTPYDYCPFSWTLFRSELFTTGLWTPYDYCLFSWTLFTAVHYWSVDTVWLLPFELVTLHSHSLHYWYDYRRPTRRNATFVAFATVSRWGIGRGRCGVLPAWLSVICGMLNPFRSELLQVSHFNSGKGYNAEKQWHDTLCVKSVSPVGYSLMFL